MYDKIKELAIRKRTAKTKEEKDAVKNAMFSLQNSDPIAYGEALERLIKETTNRLDELTVSEKMGEVTKIVSMSYIAQNYFGKTRSWLAHKLNGDIVNGKESSFTEEELYTLKMALNDLSKKLGSISAVL
ncbi:DUF5053 domain-containing protein [Parabacteroides sp. AM08-6]|uniref:DUF5053 domain-containing protein n=1 Tax=Parabacteroides sp. AM08-6 TaxID=2292053 RepID=UPI000EFF4623|nr:DUF5053 domain-containing protein [Parabacteroides sp. AM08-6]RHJ78092.1 DUF5053 domain-containing protein [Parabacteroides sp. AM08-6]